MKLSKIEKILKKEFAKEQSEITANYAFNRFENLYVVKYGETKSKKVLQKKYETLERYLKLNYKIESQ